MSDEAVSNNIDINPIVEELQILNKGVVSNGEKLDSISEYLIAKNIQDADKESAAKQAELEKSAEDKRSAEEKAAEQQEQAETYTEILTQINDGVQLTNQLLAVQSIYIGVIVGLLFIKIFVDRLTKR